MGRTVAIIQARMGSTRLPGKVLMELAGQSVLFHVVQRSQQMGADAVVVATSARSADDPIAQACDRFAWRCFRGSERDVLDRYCQAAREHHAENMVRVTADNPLVCPLHAREAIEQHLRLGADYTEITGLPAGAEVEVISLAALERAWREGMLEEEREHVTTYILRSGNFKKQRISASPAAAAPDLRLTVDTPEDLEMMRQLYARLYRNGEVIALENVVRLLRAEPSIAEINARVARRAV